MQNNKTGWFPLRDETTRMFQVMSMMKCSEFRKKIAMESRNKLLKVEIEQLIPGEYTEVCEKIHNESILLEDCKAMIKLYNN